MVDYFPGETAENHYRAPLRTIAIRICKRQGELFGGGEAVQYFAVRTNLWEWKPQRLREWHRQKAGSIEAAHAVIRNELAGGVLLCGRFGANAAWLRFLIFHTPGKLVRHARRVVLRLTRSLNRFSNRQGALRLLPLPS